jgi:hypothetical protein
MTDKNIKSKEYHRRVENTQGFCAGRPCSEMFELFNFPRATVYRVATRYRDPEISEDGSQTVACKIHITARPVRTCKGINRVQKPIKKDSGICPLPLWGQN